VSAAFVEVGIGDITLLPDRMRRLRSEVVDELAESMAARGLIEPIVVRRAAAVTAMPCFDNGFFLVAGLHRLKAAKKLKWPSIAAVVLNGVDADADCWLRSMRI
jgi:ParB family chromosome partitioning protein